jgi:hypothetical protein
MQPPPSRGDTTAAALTGITPAAAADVAQPLAFGATAVSTALSGRWRLLRTAHHPGKTVAFSFLRLREGKDYYPMIFSL